MASYELTMLQLTGLVFMINSVYSQHRKMPCYDASGQAIECMPSFENTAFGKTAIVTNTCGLTQAQQFCERIRYSTKCGSICDANDRNNKHPASYMTDFDTRRRPTWWQSETMLEGVNSVNITLNLGKSFIITYIRIKFHSSRPESFAIYKRTNESSPWVPYQFYSGSCQSTYGKPNDGIITSANEKEAICTPQFSDVSPLNGGLVAFSTLVGRPSASNFANSTVLQEWVTATDIRLVLTRMNTFGDEIFGEPEVLKLYYYAVTDLAVAGRCNCNGHANECIASTARGQEGKMVCNCKHHTKGQTCEMCEDFYFRGSKDDPCQPCKCNPTGSVTKQCNSSGHCQCKPGITGDKCNG